MPKNKMAPQVGFEPTTPRLTAECSTVELLRNFEFRQRPTLPEGLPSSTIGAEGLNFCVRYGNRCIPFAIVTGFTPALKPGNLKGLLHIAVKYIAVSSAVYYASSV